MSWDPQEFRAYPNTNMLPRNELRENINRRIANVLKEIFEKPEKSQISFPRIKFVREKSGPIRIRESKILVP